jgi:23S rRNA (guanine1835-N2)-methyltransferase
MESCRGQQLDRVAPDLFLLIQDRQGRPVPHLELDDRTLALDRLPLRGDDPLRAWDAADEYLLKEISGRDTTGRVLVVHDAFGALTVGLQGHQPISWSDSFLAAEAIEHNHRLNSLTWESKSFVPGDRPPTGPFDLVALKLPKSLAHLEDLLLRLRPQLAPGACILAGGMIKHTPSRAYRLMERVLGPVKTSLGWKKARIAEATFDMDREFPAQLPDTTYSWGDPPVDLVNGPNLFSRSHPDPGTELLLDHLPETSEPLRAADLGCGNGILAIALGRRCPRASIVAVDESFQAVASARANVAAAGLEDRIRCEAGDGLAAAGESSLDLVVCNPPFHQAQTVGDQLAWRMFTQARHALAPQGRLLVVGNRHLGYHVKLKRIFGGCRTVASDRRFVVLAADL